MSAVGLKLVILSVYPPPEKVQPGGRYSMRGETTFISASPFGMLSDADGFTIIGRNTVSVICAIYSKVWPVLGRLIYTFRYGSICIRS